MKLSRIAIGLLAGTMFMSPALAAQSDKAAPAAQQPAQDTYKPKISSGAAKAFQEFQAAVVSKDRAAIAAKLPAVQEAAKSKDEKYALARLQLQAAADVQDLPAMVAAVEAILATQVVPASTVMPLYTNIGKVQYNNKQFAEASKTFDRVLQLDPANRDILLLQAETLGKQGRAAEGLALVDRAIAAEEAANGKASESLLRFAFATAYNNKIPSFAERSVKLVTTYPTQANWTEALHIYQRGRNMDPVAAIDVSRLLYAVNGMNTPNDYYRYATAAVTKGFPGEAKAVMEAGFQAGTIAKTDADIAALYASAVAKSQGDRASLAAQAKTASASPDGKKAIIIGDAYYGYGDYPAAIALYRSALTKAGVDKDLANLHLGMALARSGDKAGAKAALSAVGGVQAATAKFWLAYAG
ncbi:tetratricopeptide repeat protein [Sphingomonas jaspsi]|uniref:tetratricopeptide repeat protein n=1 Tax=Sphingomonas jaspsi TaxID=392409 RepID=UPI0004B2C2BC|nr:tetratricopeptide repeat protein [Sphingomonas jaspsi]